jgi:nucleotide-binding universal stress UspA family protein
MSLGGIRRIVVGVDGSKGARSALEWAVTLARSLQAEVIAVFAVNVSQHDYYAYGLAVPLLYEDEWRRELQHAFEHDWCAPLRLSGLEFKTVIEDGRPASVILSVAERLNADMIVVGRRGRSVVAEIAMGSVSREVSHHATRPVTLVSATSAPGSP